MINNFNLLTMKRILVLSLVIVFMACNKKTATNTSENKTSQMTEVNLFETLEYTDRISVTLKNDEPKAFESRHAEYGMKSMHRISRSQFVYMFQFDEEKISLDELMELCKQDKSVVEVKKLTYSSKKKK